MLQESINIYRYSVHNKVQTKQIVFFCHNFFSNCYNKIFLLMQGAFPKNLRSIEQKMNKIDFFKFQENDKLFLYTFILETVNTMSIPQKLIYTF